ncbi:TetR/AcrR family transcriptional regulator [Rhodanobacter sp. A1T4]|uniref:TetR/AcrR family transcriptional regulator n=1 Tax=Rhodanobacter sp. A1T4 TaxID=2723087 RepID=UPI00160C2F0F|nr:TetR/AcrR family transcriptional regulator [Rhodanobacter sp. A1T4]MBB6247811.1 AcrR family transcriptional regulator [Rhodanobacter sp. A1T4]
MRKKLTVNKLDPPALALHEAEVLDERVRRSRTTVLAATAELLFDRGFAGASVDEISRRSGVAKTTIYRHWPTRVDLLRDACSTISTPQGVPDTGSFETDVTALMADLVGLLRTAKWTSVLPSIIDAAERDPDIADMYSKLQRGYSAPFETVILRAVDRGELPGDTDAAMLIAALTGPLFYRRWFSRDPLTDDFAIQIVQRVIR